MISILSFFVLSLFSLSFVSGQTCQTADNLVKNCGFNQGITNFVKSGQGNFIRIYNLDGKGTSNSDGNAALFGSYNGKDDIISQTLPLTALATYRVSFEVNVLLGDDVTIATQVEFDGQLLFKFTGARGNPGTELTPHNGQESITQIRRFYTRTYTVTVSDVDAAAFKIKISGQTRDNYVAFDNLKVVLLSGGAAGDPQFTGFLGQDYQVHGSSGNVYNIISSKHLQYNAMFSFLDAGKCRVGTDCFSHPGNYFGSVGVLIKNDGSDANDQYHSRSITDMHATQGAFVGAEDATVSPYKLIITAGSVDAGMTVTLGNQTLAPSNNHIKLSQQSSLYIPSPFECYIETVDFTIKLENSDMFLNQRVSINSELLSEIKLLQQNQLASPSSTSTQQMPHGILGQTWQMKQYDNRWKFIEGTLSEYIVGDGLLGQMFKYNRFD